MSQINSIELASLHFHSKPNNLEMLRLLPNIHGRTEKHFGVVTVKARNVELTQVPIFLLFTIDITESMCEKCGSSASKLDNVKETFRNMMTVLANLSNSAEIYICVHAFNTKVKVTVETIRLTTYNVDEVITKIIKLKPKGCTAIDSALKASSSTMQQYSSANPTHQIGHIFMTDGEASYGITEPSELALLVDAHFTNIFIGFGIEHNAEILQHLSNGDDNEYVFVDKMENAPLAYGEIVHRFLYPAAKRVVITAFDGLLYDWQTNAWVQHLTESVIVSESEKTYHIITNDIENVNVVVMGVSMHSEESSLNAPQFLATTSPATFDTNLDKYLFRQRVQELLYYARTRSDTFDASHKTFKSKLENIYRDMRRFIRISEFTDSNLAMFHELCEDIRTVYHTFDTEHRLMYAMSRENSNGRQQSYTSRYRSEPVELIPPSPLVPSTVKYAQILPVVRGVGNSPYSTDLDTVQCILPARRVTIDTREHLVDFGDSTAIVQAIDIYKNDPAYIAESEQEEHIPTTFQAIVEDAGGLVYPEITIGPIDPVDFTGNAYMPLHIPPKPILKREETFYSEPYNYTVSSTREYKDSLDAESESIDQDWEAGYLSEDNLENFVPTALDESNISHYATPSVVDMMQSISSQPISTPYDSSAKTTLGDIKCQSTAATSTLTL
jgi:hypothetical protein